MEPRRLSEQEASALVAEWLGHDGEYVPLPPTRGALVHSKMQVQYLWGFEDEDDGWDMGLDVRRAMEGLNALACCRGFGVDENAAFWRREFVKQGDPDASVSSSPYHALDPALLSRYRVEIMATATTEATASAIVACFSMDEKSRAMKTRQLIHERLAPYLTQEPPLLDLELDPMSSQDFGASGPGDYVEHVRCCMEEAENVWESGVSERVAMVCPVVVDTERVLRELGALARVDGVEIRELYLVVQIEPSASVVREVSALMRTLVQTDATEDMTWNFVWSDRLCFEAVFSAIPEMQSLKAVSVQADDLERASTTAVQSYYTWLAYTLSTCQQAVALEVQLTHGANARLLTAMQNPRALLDGISFGRDDLLIHAPYGSYATLPAVANLTTSITRRIKLRESPVSETSTQEQRVHLIATRGASTVIVWPGFGLMWADTSILRDHSLVPVGSERPSSIVRDITFSKSDCAAVAGFVAEAGSLLRRIGLEKITLEDHDAFQQILRSCPQLESLSVGAMNHIGPLLTAFDDDDSGITTLTFGSIQRPDIDELLIDLEDHDSPIANRLQRLSFERTTFDRDETQRMAYLLASNGHLEYLQFGEVYDDEELSIGNRLLSNFVDQPLPQTLSSQRATYTFLLAARRHRVLRSLPVPCAQAVAEYAATRRVRHVLWTELR